MMAMGRVMTLRGELKQHERLSAYTTWRVGGPARVLYRPADLEDLVEFLATLDADEPLLWLGLGSNLLVRDGGFAGTVIATQGRLNRLELLEDGLVYAEAGVACAHLARFAARNQLGQAAFFAGIPGTVGGALALNAGAFGGETWQQVVKVEMLNRFGERKIRTPEDFTVRYRQVDLPDDEWFAGAYLYFPPGNTVEQAEIRVLLDKRSASQPTNQASAGSTFRNPPGDHAARLIDSLGLKGMRIGGAEVSHKHANFIINTGNATAADIEQLIGTVQAKVKKQTGIDLVPEVHIVGEPE